MIKRSEKDIKKKWGDRNNIIVTCCCVTYNHENYISDALDSMLMQETDFPFEIIVRDDASTDKTAEIIKTYEEKFPTIIKPIFEKENLYLKGIKPTRPIFEKAKGKYLALLEGDDYWTDPLKLQKQVDILESNPDISLVFNNAYVHEYDENGNIVNKYKHTENLKSGFVTIAQILEKKIVPTGSVVFKNVNVNKFLQDSFPVGDTSTFMYLAKFGKIYYEDIITSVYRLLPTGAVKSFHSTIKKNEEFIPYYKILEQEFKEFNISKTIKKLILKRHEKLLKLYIKEKKYPGALKHAALMFSKNPYYFFTFFIKHIKI